MNNRWWQRLAVLSRLLLAAAFLPSGLTKVIGQRFTTIDPGTPIGYFFESLYQTGMYYRFIGLMQVAAAVLLLIPRTAPLGAVVYLPIILNIFVITVSLRFTGTPVITGLMLLANLFLLCWEYDRFQGVRRSAPPARAGGVDWWEAVLWGCGAAALFGLAYLTRFSVLDRYGLPGAIVFAAAGFAAGLLMSWHLRTIRSA